MNLKRRPFVVQSDTYTCIEANAAGKSIAMICSNKIICIWMNALHRKFTQFRLMPHKLLSWYSGYELFIESLKKKCVGSLARQELFLLQIYENKHLSITTQNCLYSCWPVLAGNSCWVGSLTCWEKGLSKKWNYYWIFLSFFLKRKNARFDEFRVATDL